LRSREKPVSQRKKELVAQTLSPLITAEFIAVITMIFFDKLAFPGMTALAGLCRIEVADLGSNHHDKFKVPPITEPIPQGMRFSSRLLDPARAGICRPR
jgi:hypothetical protein